jgi:hypothetical protein
VGAGAGGGAFAGTGALTRLTFPQPETGALGRAAAPESGTAQTAKADKTDKTSSSDGRSKTPMINRFAGQLRRDVAVILRACLTCA